MRTTALLSLLSLWTEMTAVRAGRLITAARARPALSWCQQPAPGEGGQHARTGLGDSAVNGDFLPIFGFISRPECGGCGSHFYGTSCSVASCMYILPAHFSEVQFINAWKVGRKLGGQLIAYQFPKPTAPDPLVDLNPSPPTTGPRN